MLLQSIRDVARFCQRRIGWSRIGVALSVAIIGVAIMVLYRMLNGIDVDDVFEAISATHWSSIEHRRALRGGYFTLTFYDLFALRTIGRRDVPYRTAALAGFTSYSVGHNVGATVFTGGAVRYRIYSHHGLDAVGSRRYFVAGLTFWLGNITVLGLGIAWAPRRRRRPVDRLPEIVNRVAACGARGARRVRRVGLARHALDRPRRMAGDAAERKLDAPADLHRHRRPHVLRARDVHAAARDARDRLRHARRGVRLRDAPGLREARRRTSACSTPASSRCRTSTARTSWPTLLLFRLLYYVTPFALALLVLGVRELAMGVGGARTWVPPRKVHAAAPLKTEIDRDV